ncbi:hypothetical protein [Polyangium aurulentum]|uniref:hypothetical protein n=1 Tax=Polyangium aurulentum TaxID=2567896 RepID=UPI0010ADD292|nr:hypothetical protein [Polyangium aurulentum]UQA58564.1 hypothetical protein E8A73_046240 [Polyangium aurulentum]
MEERLTPGHVGDYYIVDEFPGWSVCTNQVTVNTNVRIDLGGTPSGAHTNEMVVDTIQYDSKLVYEFAFRGC